MIIPELLIPAGSLEKLKTAALYGADAVYLSGQKFGLRTAAENFTLDELEVGIGFAKAHGVKTYIVLNGFLHDKDLAELPAFVKAITTLGADGVIASDLGVITTVTEHSEIPVHLSTQASCLNKESGLLWRDLGVKRLILGREVSIAHAGQIKKSTGLEVELFIHGSMCMAYSGNCTISNFTQGRDSNRGGCAQSCRFSYTLVDQPDAKPTYLMSSKDLLGLRLIPQFAEAEIDSVKIEGRMRSPLYAGMTAKLYRQALDAFSRSRNEFDALLEHLEGELEKIPHREYTQASLIQPASSDSVLKIETRSLHRPEYQFVGIVNQIRGDSILVEVRSAFKPNEMLEVVSFDDHPIPLPVAQVKSIKGEDLEMAKISTLVRLPRIPGVSEGQLIRKQVIS